MAHSTERRRFALLDAAFRPMFGLAALWAIIVMGRTVLVFSGWAPSPDLGIVRWHGHEMLFGFLPATVAGFLLTAVPNWTASRPVSGWPLAGLVLLWLAARAALWNGPATIPALLLDAAFLPAVAGVVARPLATRGGPRAWLPVGVALAFTAANVLWYAGAMLALPQLDARAVAFAAMLAGLLIAIIGGRIVPAFTRNRLVAEGMVSALPRAAGPVDGVAIGLSAAVAVAELAHPPTAAALAAGAAVAHAVRLLGWRGARVAHDPLLFVLHVGYGWLAAGYAVRACALLGPAWSGPWLLHGVLVGAVGTMTLAVMSRATLGHTGRPLRAGPLLALGFALVQVAAVARLVAPWSGTAAWMIAALAWMAAFALYLGVCGRALLTPRPPPRSSRAAPAPAAGPDGPRAGVAVQR